MKTFLLTCIALSALACDDADMQIADGQGPDVQAAEDERPLRPGPCLQQDAVSL